MPTLLVLNGPPGIGKSIIAARYVADRPLALNLDLDVLRALLGDWQRTPTDAGILTRRLAVRMAAEHLAGGHDVVVPQYVAHLPFLDELAEVATDARARFREVLLTTDRDDAVRRFLDRPHSAAELERAGGPDGLAAMYDRLQQSLAARDGLLRIESIDGRIEETYRELLTRDGGVTWN